MPRAMHRQLGGVLLWHAWNVVHEVEGVERHMQFPVYITSCVLCSICYVVRKCAIHCVGI